MQIFIHIGYPKTGTSAIQSHIFTNQQWLEEHGIYVPRYGFGSGLGHCFLADTASLQMIHDDQKEEMQSGSLFQGLAEELANCASDNYQRALISWEGLAKASEQTIRELKTALDHHQITLLAYVRDQSALYQSDSLQQLESLWNFSAETFFEPGNLSETTLASGEFTQSLERWQAVFDGKLDIRVRLYEKSLLVENNVVIDFLDWLDLTPDEHFCLQGNQVNHSLDVNAAALLLVASRAGASNYVLTRLVQALSEVTGGIEQPSRSFLTRADQDQIEAHFQQSNAALFEKFRPENAGSGTADLLKPQNSAVPGSDSSSLYAYLRNLHRALSEPKPKIWEGGPLVAGALNLITNLPGSGWRHPNTSGLWSRGERSKLIFRLPEISPTRGPRALRLNISGLYYNGHTETRVIVDDHTRDIDLRNAVITISIDNQIRDNGVVIELEHRFSAEQLAQASDKPPFAFKLQSIFYTFVWH